jgi:O-antigen/teichoic acid export membrane protein
VIDDTHTDPLPQGRIERLVGPHGGFFRTSNVVILQMAILGGSGFLFWLIAANRFSAFQLGEASALVSITMFVTFLTTLGLPVTVTRFGSGRSIDDRVVFSWSIWITSGSSLLGSILIVAIASDDFAGPILAPGRLVGVVLMFLTINGLSLITLVDYRQLALGHHRIVLIRAGVYAVGRLVAVVAIPWSSGPIWIWAAMCLPVPVALLVGTVVGRVDVPILQLRPLPEHRDRLVRFTITNWLSLTLTQAPFFAFPVIVLIQVSAVENANFHIAWTMAAMAFMIPQVTGRVLLQEAHHDEVAQRALSWFSLKLTTAFALVTVLLTVPVASLVSRLYGAAYEQAGRILPLLMLALLPFAVTTTVLNYVRARERNRATIVVSLTLAVAVLVPAWFAVDRNGAAGASAAWLFGHMVTAFLALAVLEPAKAVAPEGTESSDVDTEEEQVPLTAMRVLLNLAALLVPFIMLGPVGLAVALAAFGARWMDGRKLAPAVSAVLLAVAAVATILESNRIVSLDYARDRPVAAAAASIAMGLMVAWAFLELADDSTRPPLVLAEDTSDAVGSRGSVRSRLRSSVRNRSAAAVGVVIGALVGALMSPVLSNSGDVLSRLLASGATLDAIARQSDPATTLAPLVPFLTVIGPLGTRLLGIIAGAVIGGLMARAPRPTSVPVLAAAGAIGVLAAVVMRNEAEALVALAALLGAGVLTAEARSRTSLAVAGALCGLACLASPDALLAVAVIVALLAVRVWHLPTGRIEPLIVALSAVVVGGMWWRTWTERGTIDDVVGASQPALVLLLTAAVLLHAVWLDRFPWWSWRASRSDP